MFGVSEFGAALLRSLVEHHVLDPSQQICGTTPRDGDAIGHVLESWILPLGMVTC